MFVGRVNFCPLACTRVKEGLGVACFATGPGLGLIMYILTTFEFPTHYFDIHLLTTSVNAKILLLQGCWLNQLRRHGGVRTCGTRLDTTKFMVVVTSPPVLSKVDFAIRPRF